MMIRSCSAATAQKARTVAGRGSLPVGLSGSVTTTDRISRPAALAEVTAAASASGSQMPPSPGAAGTKRASAPPRPAWAAYLTQLGGGTATSAPVASSRPNSSGLLPGPQTTEPGLVGRPRRSPYPAAGARRAGSPDTG